MIDLSKNTNPYYPKKNMISYLKKNIINIKKYSERHVKIKNSYFLLIYNKKCFKIIGNTEYIGVSCIFLQRCLQVS